MKEMAHRMEHVPAFYNVIERYSLNRISCHFDLSDLDRAKKRIWVENLQIDWGYTNNPYSFGFRCLMDMFHTHRAEFDFFLPIEEKIDFIFDTRGEKKAILKIWDDYVKQRPDEVRKYYSAAGPSFQDDEDFMPLQAADFWAWWVRKWYLAGTPDKIETEDFGTWQPTSEIPPSIAISFDEDQIAEALISVIREGIEPGRPIYDLKFMQPPTALSATNFLKA
jgi:hypothetical protein